MATLTKETVTTQSIVLTLTFDEAIALRTIIGNTLDHVCEKAGLDSLWDVLEIAVPDSGSDKYQVAETDW